MTPRLARRIASDQRAHAVRRAAERFGLTLNRAALDALAGMIRRGELAHIVTRPSGKSLYAMKVDESGRECCVVYDSHTGAVVSFLPRPRAGVA